MSSIVKFGIANVVQPETNVFHGSVTSRKSFGRVNDLIMAWVHNRHQLSLKISSDLSLAVHSLLEFCYPKNNDVATIRIEVAIESTQILLNVRFENYILNNDDNPEKKLSQYWMNSEESSLLRKMLYPHDHVEVRFAKNLNLMEWRIIRRLGPDAANYDSPNFLVFTDPSGAGILETNHEHFEEMGDTPYESWLQEIYKNTSEKTKSGNLLVKGESYQEQDEWARVVSDKEIQEIDELVKSSIEKTTGKKLVRNKFKNAETHGQVANFEEDQLAEEIDQESEDELEMLITGTVSSSSNDENIVVKGKKLKTQKKITVKGQSIDNNDDTSEVGDSADIGEANIEDDESFDSSEASDDENRIIGKRNTKNLKATLLANKNSKDGIDSISANEVGDDEELLVSGEQSDEIGNSVVSGETVEAETIEIVSDSDFVQNEKTRVKGKKLNIDDDLSSEIEAESRIDSSNENGNEKVVFRASKDIANNEKIEITTDELLVLQTKVSEYEKLLLKKERINQKREAELKTFRDNMEAAKKVASDLEAKQVLVFREKAMRLYDMNVALKAEKQKLEKTIFDLKRNTNIVANPTAIGAQDISSVGGNGVSVVNENVESGNQAHSGISSTAAAVSDETSKENSSVTIIGKSNFELGQIAEDLQKKFDRTSKALETERARVSALNDRLGVAEKAAQNSAPIIEGLEKKVETALKTAQQHQKDVESIKQKLVHSEGEKNKVSNELLKAQAQIKTLMKRQAS